MTTSIKIATTSEVKTRLSDLFGEIDSSNIAVVSLKDTDIVENKVSMSHIGQFHKNIELVLNRKLTEQDVSVIKEESNFSISTATPTQLSEKLKELGFDNLDLSNIAVVKAEDLGLKNENTFSKPVQTKKFK